MIFIFLIILVILGWLLLFCWYNIRRFVVEKAVPS